MAYSGGGFKGYDATYGYVARSLRLLRNAVGPDIPIHAAGGVANRMNAEELKAFVDAVTDEGSVTGWSLYDFQTTGPQAWAALKPLGTRLGAGRAGDRPRPRSRAGGPPPGRRRTPGPSTRRTELSNSARPRSHWPTRPRAASALDGSPEQPGPSGVARDPQR